MSRRKWIEGAVDGVPFVLSDDGAIRCLRDDGVWTAARAEELLTAEQIRRAKKIARGTVTINMGPGR